MSVIDDEIQRGRTALINNDEAVTGQLVNTYQQTTSRLDVQLKDLDAEIVRMESRGEEVTPAKLFKKAQYEALIVESRAAADEFTRKAEPILSKNRSRVSGAGTRTADNALSRGGIDRSTLGGVNTSAVENARHSLNSSPVRESLSNYGDFNAGIIRNEIAIGRARGSSARDVTTNIRRQFQGDMPKARIEALVRTESARALRAAQMERYQRVKDNLSGLRWVADKSARTCAACLALDGKIWPVDEAPDLFHISCRCMWSPVVKGYEDDYETGEEWLGRQAPEVQDRVLGRPGGKLFRDNGFSLLDFIGVRSDNKWGDSVFQISAKAASRRGPGGGVLPLPVDGGRPAIESPIISSSSAPAIEWQPSMTSADAREWARDSAWKGKLYHATSQDAVAGIKKDGFRSAEGYQSGDLGYGTYFSLSKESGAFYESEYFSGKNSTVLEAVVKVDRIMTFDEFLDFQTQHDLQGPIFGPEHARKFTEKAIEEGWDGATRKVYDAEDVFLDGDVHEIVIFNKRNIVVIDDDAPRAKREQDSSPVTPPPPVIPPPNKPTGKVKPPVDPEPTRLVRNRQDGIEYADRLLSSGQLSPGSHKQVVGFLNSKAALKDANIRPYVDKMSMKDQLAGKAKVPDATPPPAAGDKWRYDLEPKARIDKLVEDGLMTKAQSSSAKANVSRAKDPNALIDKYLIKNGHTPKRGEGTGPAVTRKPDPVPDNDPFHYNKLPKDRVDSLVRDGLLTKTQAGSIKANVSRSKDPDALIDRFLIKNGNLPIRPLDGGKKPDPTPDPEPELGGMKLDKDGNPVIEPTPEVAKKKKEKGVKIPPQDPGTPTWPGEAEFLRSISEDKSRKRRVINNYTKVEVYPVKPTDSPNMVEIKRRLAIARENKFTLDEMQITGKLIKNEVQSNYNRQVREEFGPNRRIFPDQMVEMKQKAYRDVMGELRPLYDPKARGAKKLPAAVANKDRPLLDVAEQSMSLYPKQWVDKAIKKIGTNEVHVTKVQRGHWRDPKGDEMGHLYVSGSGMKMESTMVHEVAHMLQYGNELIQVETEFYERRTLNEELVEMRSIPGYNHYPRGETTRPDDFWSPYMGKDYGYYAPRPLEMLSMSAEQTFSLGREDGKPIWEMDDDVSDWFFGILSHN